MVKLSIGNPSKGNIINSKKKKFVALQTREVRKMTKNKRKHKLKNH